ncbi:PAS domain-containing sensor histidine kinase [Sphingomonas sp. BAUL-RG-20F-R05-02]|uniref:PAS domain-containing sensor histidine kinase n=1 Tax=Sphingomonas sp. BAUL-RG-20F-R05-02 TaxID=2914830 RepID=UPI001F5832CC|nr:PAS domain-containing sensor histidine kinase [Sphingomonas sp. BAUL-RG-20F-R05-02]
MTDVPISNPQTRSVFAAAVGFALLAAATALATAGLTSLAELRNIPTPLFPAIGVALAGLVVGGRRLWPAVVIGAVAALLVHPHTYPPMLEVLASLAGASAAWLGASLIPAEGDVRALQPSLLALLAAGGAVVITCAAGAVLGALLRGSSLDSTDAVREFAITAPVQTILALALLLWPARATRRPGLAPVLLGAIGLPLLALAALSMLDIRPGAWVVVPLLLWAGVAYRRSAIGAALILLLLSGASLVIFSITAGAPLTADLVPFLALSATAALMIDALGIAGRATLPAHTRRATEMTAFVADAPVAIAALDAELRYRVVSRRYLRDLRLENEPSIIGRRPAEVLPPYAAHLGDGAVRALAGEKVSRPVSKVRMADGSCEYLRSELQPWHDSDGAIGGVMVFGEIATEAVRSRAALEEAETRYRAVFEQAAAGFARTGLDGRFLEVNDRFCEIVGHDRAALLTKSYRDITHPLDLGASDAILQAMIARSDEQFSVEKRYCRHEGQVIWVTMSATMIRDRDGQPLYAASAIQDITARKDALAALAKSELRLRLAQSAAGAGLWEIDFERDAIIASADMLRMHGVAPERTNGVPLREWRALFDQPTLDLIDSSGFASREVANHDIVYPVVRSDGTLRWIHSMGRTYRTTDDTKRIIGLSIDVTAAQAAQAELRHAQATMLRVSHLSAMGSVAATLAHELNQPLAAIVNYIEVCVRILKAQADGHPPQLLDAVLQAQTQAMRAGQLVQKMRQLTPNSAATRRREPIGNIIENAYTAIAPDAVAENVTVQRNYEHGNEEILADRLQIEQVLIGIFHNAIEAMRGYETKRVDLTVARRGDTLIIRIADTGVGVAAAAIQQVFEPFGDPRDRGSGLALPVCRTIIESHDGKLTAESAPEGGAAFLIALPFAPVREAGQRRALPDPVARA